MPVHEEFLQTGPLCSKYMVDKYWEANKRRYQSSAHGRDFFEWFRLLRCCLKEETVLQWKHSTDIITAAWRETPQIHYSETTELAVCDSVALRTAYSYVLVMSPFLVDLNS